MDETMRRYLDDFTLALLAVMLLAWLFPAQGSVQAYFSILTTFAISLLFFLHGARLAPREVLRGATHWKLHLCIFLCTFGLFPLVGFLLHPIMLPLLGKQLWVGFLFLCVLPGTVQSAIAFTSLAGGNISAAVCSASASSVIGIFLTPMLLTGLISSSTVPTSAWDAILKICAQLLVPFLLGQLARPWVFPWTERHVALVRHTDQTSILLVVYTAFGGAVSAGIFAQVSPDAALALMIACTGLLAIMLGSIWALGTALGFDRADRIALLFCGSKKSMATGVPMAQLLFSGAAGGFAILPLLFFHQLQLVVCSMLAQRFAERREAAA
jgi:solute carrier family 10 (sodium/bile acid cotransporter), member 7